MGSEAFHFWYSASRSGTTVCPCSLVALLEASSAAFCSLCDCVNVIERGGDRKEGGERGETLAETEGEKCVKIGLVIFVACSYDGNINGNINATSTQHQASLLAPLHNTLSILSFSGARFRFSLSPVLALNRQREQGAHASAANIRVCTHIHMHNTLGCVSRRQGSSASALIDGDDARHTGLANQEG